ncbi:Hpt domain-containing protein [Engelhardtia mirabilis]|uniref:Hybrid sensory histidine kinase TorS n=1 Tax=Engelhardtia mirabilis TaxID=2528011 RepID=A0A518BRI6_9BACT|nr:hybrid sensory histidine kinase TorS [Planctomycetes bacterium Pla133]QDV03911.1 hybrid sensory histidine kinase TorS [Planctomycetes bacterium Pla86]
MDNSDDKSLLDLEIVASLKALGGDDDPELFADLVSMFMDDTPARLQAMDEALSAGDSEALSRVAHALKSSCGNLGAFSLAELCRAIESAGRGGDVDGARPLVEQSKTQYERVRTALEAELA